MGLKTVDEFHHAVVFQREAVSQNPDGGFRAVWKAADGEQQEILLWFETSFASCRVSFSHKMADAMSKLGQRAVFLGGYFRGHVLSLS
jgi:hypothetical protein